MTQIKSTLSRGNYVVNTASSAVNQSSVLKNMAVSLRQESILIHYNIAKDM